MSASHSCRSSLLVSVMMLVVTVTAVAQNPPAAQPAQAPKDPPVTPKKPVVDTYHGVQVTDDYQWLENWDDPNVKAWSEAQNAYARGVLDKLPSVAEIRKRLTELDAGDTVAYGGLRYIKGKLFAMKFAPPKQQPFLVLLKSAEDTAGEQTVVDPTVIDASGKTAIDWYVPSPDGKLVAVSLSVGGSESGTAHVFDVATGKETGDIIPRAHGGTAGGSLTWSGDGSGFYYTRYPRGTERPKEDMDFYQQCWWHKLGPKTVELGTEVDDDVYVIGKEFPRIAEIELKTSDDGQYVLATTQKGDGGEYRFDLILAGPAGGAKPTLKLADFADKIVKAEFGSDGSLYLLSRADAPRGKILKIKLPPPDKAAGSEPALTAAVTIVPQGDATIEDVTPTKSRLYVTDQLGGPSQLRVFDLTGKPLAPFPLKPISAIAGAVALDGDDVLYNLQSYVDPPAWYRYDAAKSESRKTALAIKSPADFSDCEVVREMATSKDGTKVPVNIIFKKGLKKDGNNPTIVWGYGGFGVNESPGFSPRRRMWIEQGGVFVLAVIRGGGEFGEDWHKAGNLTHKQNCFDDFYAACQHMIDAGYTKREKLAIFGGSNGGLLMGATETQHPDLCQCVVSAVGIYDMLRVELSSNGSFNVTEYGTVKDPEQFKALYAYSPYHHVKDGQKYPATLFLTGAVDPRVDPLQSRKMTARLQAALVEKDAAKAGQADAAGHPGNLILLRTSAGGHGIGASLNERIEQNVDIYAFIFGQLGMKYQAK